MKDYNLWVYAIKSSIFGEFQFSAPEALAKLFLLVNLLLVILSLAAMCYVLIRGKEVHAFARYGLFGLWLIQIVCFILFNIQYPFGCTMDFRYIVPTALFGGIYLAIVLDKLKKHDTRIGNALFYVGISAIALFAVVSVMFYTI